jgi:PAS domain S-box-containing protein
MNTPSLHATVPFSVLLIGAGPAALRMLSASAAELEMPLLQAASEADALAHASTSKVAVAIIDLVHLQLDPATFGARLRALQQAVTPLVFLVDFETPRAQIDAAHALGIVDFLSVPLIGGVVRARLEMAALHWQTVQIGERLRVPPAADRDPIDWLHLVFDNTTDYALIIADTNGIITQWKGMAENIVGWTAAEAVGKSFALIFTPGDKACGRPEVELDVARAQGRADDKRWHLRRDGTQFYADGVMVPLLDEGGALRGYAKIFRDVTERKLADEKLNLNRDRFSQLLASSSEGIYGMGPDNSCSFINPAGAAMLGYAPEELQGRLLHDLIHQKHADGSFYPLEQCRLNNAARAGTSIRVDDEVFWHKNGHAVPIAYSVAPILVDGAPNGAVVTFTDSTERREAEAQLRASEQRVRLATDAAELGMWRWQPEDDRIVWENQRMYDIFRMAHDAPPISSARFASDYVHPADSADFNEAVARTLSTGARFHFEGRFLPGDGGPYRWIEFTGLLQPRVVGTRPQMIGTANDITARKRTEEDLRTLAAELSESNRKKGEFLATLAHELRNPLAPIRTGLAVLGLGGDKPEAVARIRAMMERQVSHMVHLVDDLLDVARISSGKVDLKIARVDVKAVVASAVETSQPLIDAAKHQLSVELSPVPLWLDADLTRLAQVVSNLLTNAAKYTLPGGRIHLKVSRDERYVLVAVTDSGMGIPRAELPTVFDMFTQVSTHAPQAQGGLGIGLSLVRHLVELHGGSVAVHSEGEGHGSTFEVRLPLADTGERRKHVRPVNLPDPTTHAGLTVLIADDNEDAADALSEFLRIAGHQVTTVNNGHDAVRTAMSLRPDAVLLDIGMPGLNGYEVARALRATSGMEETVLVALTGWGTDDDRSRASAAGFDHHLTKPTSAADIVKVLETARHREG